MKKNTFYALLVIFLVLGNENKLCGQWVQTYELGQIDCLGSIDSRIFVGATPGFLASIDNGNSWSIVFKGHSFDTSVDAIISYGRRLFAGGNGIFLSSDSGVSWGKINNSLLVLSFFKNGSDLFAINYNIERSIDSGVSWMNIYNGDCFILDMAAIGSTLFAGCENSAGHSICGVLRSTDDGLSWQSVISGSYGQSYSNWYVTTIGNIVIAAPTDKDTAFISRDTGTTWQPLRIPTPLGYGAPSITSFAVFGTNIFAGYEDAVGGVTLSTDTGKTWNIVGSMHRVNSLFIYGDYIFAGTNNTGLYRARLSDFGINAVSPSPKNISKLTLLSNPITSSADFQFDALKEATVFELFDALGRSVLRQQLSAGQASLRVNLQNMPAGIYFARLGGESVKIIKN